MTIARVKIDERKKEKVAPAAQLFLFFSHHYMTFRPSPPKGNFLVSGRFRGHLLVNVIHYVFKRVLNKKMV